ncbi:MAG: proline hydroxylase, partial [Mesorhizobium sp.]
MTIHSIGSKAAVRSAEARVAGYDWQALAEEMSGYGCAVMEKLLTPQECRE